MGRYSPLEVRYKRVILKLSGEALAGQQGNGSVLQWQRCNVGNQNGDDEFRGLQFAELPFSHQANRKNNNKI